MDNDEKVFLSFIWLTLGNVILIFILIGLGFNPLYLKSTNSWIGLIILFISVVLSVSSLVIFLFKSEEEMREYRRKQYPIRLKAIQDARQSMVKEYPDFKDTINDVANEEERRIT